MAGVWYVTLSIYQHFFSIINKRMSYRRLSNRRRRTQAHTWRVVVCIYRRKLIEEFTWILWSKMQRADKQSWYCTSIPSFVPPLMETKYKVHGQENLCKRCHPPYVPLTKHSDDGGNTDRISTDIKCSVCRKLQTTQQLDLVGLLLCFHMMRSKRKPDRSGYLPWKTKRNIYYHKLERTH